MECLTYDKIGGTAAIGLRVRYTGGRCTIRGLGLSMTLADQRFARAFTCFLHQEIGKAVNSKCVYTVRDHFSDKRGREAFYAATTQTSVVCGDFEYSYGSIWPFRDHWKAWNHRFRTIEMATDRNLVEVFGLNAAIVSEPEKLEDDPCAWRDSGTPFFYLHAGEHEKMFDEGALRRSKIVHQFITQLKDRVTRILEGADSLTG